MLRKNGNAPIMKRTSKKLLIAALVFSLAVITTVFMTALCSAYPTGYTSDKVIVTSTISSEDLAASGDTVHYVYSYGAATYYCRSTDKGSTWNTVRIDLSDNNGGDGNALVTATGNTVYVAWYSKERNNTYETLLRRSTDGGATWNTGYSDYKSWQGYAMCKGAPAIAYQLSNECYFATINGGFGTGHIVSDDDGSSESRYPSIASSDTPEGTKYYVAYGNNKAEIWNRRCDTNGPVAISDCVMAEDFNWVYNYPKIEYVTGDAVFKLIFSKQPRSGGNSSVVAVSWIGGVWTPQPPGLLYDNVPSLGSMFAIAPSGLMVSHSAAGANIMRITGGTDDTMIMSGSYTGALAASANGSSYAAGPSGGGVRIKRTDDVNPTSSGIAVAGNQHNGKWYIRGDYRIDFQNVIDDWNVTGTDPLGDSFTNGVSKIELAFASGPHGEGGWYALPTDRGSTLDNAPWSATVNTNGAGDQTIYIRGTLTDTAGNTYDITSPAVVYDKTPPNVTITHDGVPNAAGWINKPVTVTITGDDPEATYEYRSDVTAGYGTGRTQNSTGWQTYTGPFTLGNGRWYVEARGTDFAGNISETDFIRPNIDTGGPVLVITKPAGDIVPSGFSSDDKYTLTGDATDANSPAWLGVYIDGKLVYETTSYFRWAYSWNVGSLPEGYYTIGVKSRDNADNESYIEKKVRVVKGVPGPDNTTVTCQDWYFAEGTTRTGFEEYLCVLNPSDKTNDLTFDFMLGTGQVITKTASVAPKSRATFNVNSWIPAGNDVSTHIHSSSGLICERPMYFNNHGWSGGHDVMGMTELKKDFYFAEGTTRKNNADGYFEEWLTLQNPSNGTATINITYMLGTGKNVDKPYQVAPHSRLTVDVANDVGLNQDVSAYVKSDIPIAAERPLYFNYHGSVTDGTTIVGAQAPMNKWCFAEGTTREGFEEYLCIQNPQSSDAQVNIQYMNTNMETTTKSLSVPAKSRATVNVANDVGSQDISAVVTSNVGIIVERPMYFNYHDKWSGGTDVLGVTNLYEQYYFAEGCTRAGFDTWYAVCNPSDTDFSIYITYMFADGTSKNGEYTVRAHQRLTVDVNKEVGPDKDVSVWVLSDSPVVIERPMYFDYHGLTGGHAGTGFGFGASQ